jgi:hypothetical protein
MDFKQYIPNHAATTLPILALLFAAHYFLLRDDAPREGIEPSGAAPSFYAHWQWRRDDAEFDVDAGLERLELDDAQRDRLIRDLLRRGEYRHARTRLLEVAAAAVLQNDQARLGETLMLLGEVAINQQELAAAEIYLQEALYLSIEQDDPMATARSYQLLGKLNIRARELARHAANIYDELWQARNSISRGYYRGIDDNLQRVIRENLEIRRYGAAADAWEALASLHDRTEDAYQAQLARIEAARLYASIGQMSHVHRLMDGLDRGQLGDAGVAEAEAGVRQEFERFEQDRARSSQARDYQMLYHHYLRLGQVERAWQFRIKSSETLANGSQRLLYQRHADVVAVLYNSNFAMDRARKYLDKAGVIYNDTDDPEMLEQTREMKAQIF